MKTFVPSIVGPRMQPCYKVVDKDGTVLGYTYRRAREKGWWFETPLVKGYGTVATRDEARKSLEELRKKGCE